MTNEQIPNLGCAERAALRADAAERPVKAPGVLPGVPAPDLGTLTKGAALRGVYRRGDAEAVLDCLGHLEHVANGWRLAEVLGWAPPAPEGR